MSSSPTWNGHIICTNCYEKCADYAHGSHGLRLLHFYCPSPQCGKRTWWKMLVRRDGCKNPKCWYRQYDSMPRWGDATREARTRQEHLAPIE